MKTLQITVLFISLISASLLTSCAGPAKTMANAGAGFVDQLSSKMEQQTDINEKIVDGKLDPTKGEERLESIRQDISQIKVKIKATTGRSGYGYGRYNTGDSFSFEFDPTAPTKPAGLNLPSNVTVKKAWIVKDPEAGVDTEVYLLSNGYYQCLGQEKPYYDGGGALMDRYNYKEVNSLNAEKVWAKRKAKPNN